MFSISPYFSESALHNLLISHHVIRFTLDSCKAGVEKSISISYKSGGVCSAMCGGQSFNKKRASGLVFVRTVVEALEVGSGRRWAIHTERDRLHNPLHISLGGLC